MSGEVRLSECETALAKVWLEHAYPGEVMTALDEAWIECACGERVEVPVVDLRVSAKDVQAAFSAHVAARLAAVPVPSETGLAERLERLIETETNAGYATVPLADLRALLYERTATTGGGGS